MIGNGANTANCLFPSSTYLLYVSLFNKLTVIIIKLHNCGNKFISWLQSNSIKTECLQFLISFVWIKPAMNYRNWSLESRRMALIILRMVVVAGWLQSIWPYFIWFQSKKLDWINEIKTRPDWIEPKPAYSHFIPVSLHSTSEMELMLL